MTRVSSFGQQSQLLLNALRNQERVALTQQQITTGKKANSFRDLTPEVQKALDARQALSGVFAFRETIQQVRQQIDSMDLQLTAAVDSARELKQGMVTALGQQDATGLLTTLDQTFQRVVSALNTRANGSHIFAGARTDQPPVTVSSLNDLQALGAAADAFNNDDNRRRAAIAEGVELEFGQLADEIGSEILQVVKDIADFSDTNPDGPLDGDLTAAQRSFLEGRIGDLESAIQTAQAVQADNGLNSNRLDVVDDQHASMEVFLQGLIGDVEDIDLAEAVTRLNQQQTTLEASFRAIGTLSRLSLLDFI